ncbi:hypothetical protein [Bradyrhizobium sp. LA2.1]|uniref:hypothetical protein n=1 Tax=Bradyrhizobium sp. LA2.1 TaxID=3156376 RepID=UPI00339410CA
MTGPIRRTIPHGDLDLHYEAGWAYVMPNFDKPNHYIVEWLSDKPPVYPYRVSNNSSQENAHGPASAGA